MKLKTDLFILFKNILKIFRNCSYLYHYYWYYHHRHYYCYHYYSLILFYFYLAIFIIVTNTTLIIIIDITIIFIIAILILDFHPQVVLMTFYYFLWLGNRLKIFFRFFCVVPVIWFFLLNQENAVIHFKSSAFTIFIFYDFNQELPILSNLYFYVTFVNVFATGKI